MFRIEGDGSYQNTIIWKDNKQISYECCEFRINVDECVALVDGVEGKLDRMIIKGIYMIISDGEFKNTRILFFDEILRGVQSLVGQIKKDHHPMITIKAVLLPNIVEFREPPPPKVDKRLETFAERGPKKNV